MSPFQVKFEDTFTICWPQWSPISVEDVAEDLERPLGRGRSAVEVFPEVGKEIEETRQAVLARASGAEKDDQLAGFGELFSSCCALRRPPVGGDAVGQHC
jgi:hypothetical protein